MQQNQYHVECRCAPRYEGGRRGTKGKKGDEEVSSLVCYCVCLCACVLVCLLLFVCSRVRAVTERQKTTANNSEQQRATTHNNEQQRTAANENEQQRPAANKNGQQQATANNSEQQRPTATNNEQQRTTTNTCEQQRTQGFYLEMRPLWHQCLLVRLFVWCCVRFCWIARLRLSD